MIQQTKGIVVRTVKYGDTSLVVAVFTKLFGLQSYMVNGVRSAKRSTAMSIAYLQVGSVLDMVVYHHERSTLQRIKECKPAVHYTHLFVDVTKNAIMLFMIELLQKCLKQPDADPDLFYFVEDVMTGLDTASPTATANLPLFFMVHLSHFFGFRLMDNFGSTLQVLDLREGQFVASVPAHEWYLAPPRSAYISQLLKMLQVEDLEQLAMNRQLRNELIDALLEFYAIHIQPFGAMRSLPVIRTLLED